LDSFKHDVHSHTSLTVNPFLAIREYRHEHMANTFVERKQYLLNPISFQQL